MPLRQSYGARRYNDLISLTFAEVLVDEFGHAAYGEKKVALEVYASVQQMSASKSLMTFQQADAIGLDIEFRNPNVRFNGIRYKGHDVVFAQPQELDRGRILRISGWYQTDNPQMI